MANFQTDAADTPVTARHVRVEHNLWIVIADRMGARILSQNGREFEPVRVFHARAEMDDGLDNDTVGRGGGYGAGRHKYEPGMEESRQVEMELAREIAIYLETSLARRDFAELALIASPQMLGEIRKSLPFTVLKTLVAESDKNIMSLAGQELRNALLAALPGPERE